MAGHLTLGNFDHGTGLAFPPGSCPIREDAWTYLFSDSTELLTLVLKVMRGEYTPEAFATILSTLNAVEFFEGLRFLAACFGQPA